ncbi:MAG: AbrB/MazE/SpoVT family DNA-binding domain-containing protein [Pseudomonadota bacterium]|jgi:AbrB family looped-hinge helix DNA binding protein
MAAATLTSKGQTTIPKEIRDFLGIGPGDKLDFVVESDGRVILRPATLDVRQLRGMLKRSGRKAVTLEEMDKAIAAGVARRRA